MCNRYPIHTLRMIVVFTTASIISISVSAVADDQQTYVFDRMWPVQKQSWYFGEFDDVTIGLDDNVYVVDRHERRIDKLTTSGMLLNRWVLTSDEEVEYKNVSLAVDVSGNVYVSDSESARIRKFTGSGDLLLEWGAVGAGPGEFQSPGDIEVDASGLVYVADRGNSRVQKFTETGTFLLQWGAEGDAPGQFVYIQDLAVDTSGEVHVLDSRDRVQRFSPEGVYLSEWTVLRDEGYFVHNISLDESGSVFILELPAPYLGYSGSGRVQRYTADGVFVAGWLVSGESLGAGAPLIAASNSGFVFVANSGRDQIEKYTSTGTFVDAWGSKCADPGGFNDPQSLCIDSQGNFYVADSGNGRIQKFAPDGVFTAQWGSFGGSKGQFAGLQGVAADSSGNVFTSERGSDYSFFPRIQRFTESGEFIVQWHPYISEEKGFFYFNLIPNSIAADSTGVYVPASSDAGSIVQFSNNLEVLGILGSPYKSVDGIALDSSQSLFVTDDEVHEVRHYSSEGSLVASWGTEGSGPGELKAPRGIALDNLGNVFVTDSLHRIQKFMPNGDLLTQWGSRGSSPGAFNTPNGMAVDASGRVYVADSLNNRIQRFRPVAVSPNAKAIVVAAGGPYPGNSLWNAVQYCVNFGRRAMNYQGFAKESVRYLSADTNFDNSGLPDEIDGNATNQNLEDAITNWAAGADSLVLFLANHGGEQTFRMSANETLSAEELKVWLDQVDSTISGPIIVVYDAPQSGSFLDLLSGPGRIVIASTTAYESAHFLDSGAISFSSFFWDDVFDGATVQEAFNTAVDAVGHPVAFQNPQMADPDNLASTTHIGNGTQNDGDGPIIISVSEPQVLSGTSTAEIVADSVTDANGVARVWAVIQPPGFPPLSGGNPIQGLPTIEMFPNTQDPSHWSGAFDEFNSEGTYTIAIYATDRQWNTSAPKLTTVSVVNALAKRAIILAGATQADPLWPGIENAVTVAYNALKGQGYSDDTIRLYSPLSLSVDVDGLNTLSNLQSALIEWSVESTQDIVVYLCGNACDGVFAVNGVETLSANQLDAWVDQVQLAITGRVVIVIDASDSGQFVQPLTPPNDKSRIVIASADINEAALFESDGDVSFSNYFWRHVLNGASVEHAFRQSATAIRFSAKGQSAQIDDNGNGIANENADGIVSSSFRIGAAVQLAPDSPLVGNVSPAAFLTSDATTFPIIAENVTATGTIDRVWAEITPPGFGARSQCVFNLVSLDLSPIANNRFEATFDDATQDGTYSVAVFAKDTEGNISTPSTTYIKRGARALADIDNDDSNDAVDVQLVINAALGMPIPFVADVNQSGTVDAIDVQLVINAALGL